MKVRTKMKVEDFLAQVPTDHWELDPKLRRDSQCPISSVKGFQARAWGEVADVIGLSDKEATLIIRAADYSSMRSLLEYGWPFLLMRSTLLTHCGLVNGDKNGN
jgi:hypothetical protein